jgi:hypothetical protein
MHPSLKISQHEHTGRLRPHEFTSYFPLAILVFLVGLILTGFTISGIASGSTPYTGPEGGSIGLSGVVPTKPPTTAAVITSPKDGQHFRDSPVTIGGTCPDGTLIEIYKNDIFAGSVGCDSNKFSIDIDLLFGSNKISAIVYDVLNQAGPASNTITIFYDSALPNTQPISLLNLSGAQLLLSTDAVYRGSFPGQDLNVPITIIGGTPPYAVNVQWGDANNKVIQRSDNLTFNAPHTYKKAGTFKITLQASDNKQQEAFLTVAAIVNGQPTNLAASGNKKAVNKLLVLWPLYAICTTLVVSFWLGERREKKILSKPISTLNPPQPAPEVAKPAANAVSQNNADTTPKT